MVDSQLIWICSVGGGHWLLCRGSFVASHLAAVRPTSSMAAWCLSQPHLEVLDSMEMSSEKEEEEEEEAF